MLGKVCLINLYLISLPGRSPGRAIVPTPGVGGGSGVSKKFNVEVFYGMGKALSGELSCPCDRSCFVVGLKSDLD